MRLSSPRHGGNNNPKGNNQYTKGRHIQRAESPMPETERETDPEREDETQETGRDSEVRRRGEERQDAERE